MSKRANDLSCVYQRNPGVFLSTENDVTTVVTKNNHWSQTFFRKIGMSIPLESKVELDDYGSVILSLVDGKKTVEEIGITLVETIEEAKTQQWERLVTYLQFLEHNKKWITRVERKVESIDVRF